MNVPLYAMLIATSIACCSLLLRRSQRRLPLSNHQRIAVGLGAFVGAMLLAKAPFYFAGDFATSPVATWLADGKSIMFGLVGGYLGVELVKAALGIRIKTGDSFAFPVAVAIAIGRLGCFAAGCCYGTVTDLPWAVHFSAVDADPAVCRHPVQLYEFLFHGSAAAFLFFATRLFDLQAEAGSSDMRRLGASLRSAAVEEPCLAPKQLTQKEQISVGQVKAGLASQLRFWLERNLIKAYIIAYLVFRFCAEFIRPEPTLAIGISIYQLTSVLLIPVFAWLWVRDLPRYVKQV